MSFLIAVTVNAEGFTVNATVKTRMISTGPIVLRRASKIRADSSHVPGIDPKRVHARAIKRIFDRESGELVGWLYEWNTGCLVPRWKSKAYKNVIYV